MAKTKPIPICSFEGCKKLAHKSSRGWNRFCSNHEGKVTITGFLSKRYSIMKRRIDGKSDHNRGNWKGKAILPRDAFYSWAKNHPVFLSLYKQWFTSNFDIKLTPSINRLNSSKGYTLDNMEWMTNSQNSSLSGAVKKMKNRKAIYDLLGVNNVKQT
jgi:hypothetical protein